MSRLLAEVMSTISRNDVLLIPFDIYFTSFLMALFPVMERESESHSVVSNSLRPHGLYSPWNSPGQNTRVDSLSLLQGIFPTQGSNPGLPHCRGILCQLSHKGSPPTTPVMEVLMLILWVELILLERNGFLLACSMQLG